VHELTQGIGTGRAERTRSNSQPATAAENRARIADIVQDNYSDLCKGETTEYGEQMPVNISAILSWINVPLVVQRTRNILRDQYPELQSNSQQSFKAVSEVGISTQESGPKNFQQDSAAEDASNAMSCFGFHGNQVHWDRNSAGRLSFGGGASRDAKEESKANPIICASESYGESADETSLFPASDSEIEEAAKRYISGSDHTMKIIVPPSLRAALTQFSSPGRHVGSHDGRNWPLLPWQVVFIPLFC